MTSQLREVFFWLGPARKDSCGTLLSRLDQGRLTGNPLTPTPVILDGSTERFCRVGEAMQDVPHYGQAALFPSELVTVGLRYAIEGEGSSRLIWGICWQRSTSWCRGIASSPIDAVSSDTPSLISSSDFSTAPKPAMEWDCVWKGKWENEEHLQNSCYLDILHTCYANYAKARPACSCSICWLRGPCTGSSSPRRCESAPTVCSPSRRARSTPHCIAWKRKGW